MTDRVTWPDNKDFAFTVFDDTDLSTLENTRPVYSFLTDLGFRTTKSVWPLKGSAVPRVGGATCEDPEYLEWVLLLQELGFEIGFHGATYHTSSRADTDSGLDKFRELFGNYPRSAANHTGCYESIYWGSNRLSGVHKLAYDLLTRYRQHNRYFGHVTDSALFWGDLCHERIRFMRNFSFRDINTLKCCPAMPYHDPQRPYVNYWFASSEGAKLESFINCISESSQDRLESEGGACIMYTHFACGFARDGRLDRRFISLMERLASKRGWFVPVETLLDYLLKTRNTHDLTTSERARLERRWLRSKLITGPS